MIVSMNRKKHHVEALAYGYSCGGDIRHNAHRMFGRFGLGWAIANNCFADRTKP